MGLKTKIQLIKRKDGHEQWYVNFPSACAQMLCFQKGEVAEWTIGKAGMLTLKLERRDAEGAGSRLRKP